MSAGRDGLALFGCTGRMGQCLVRALREESFADLHLSCALASPSSSRLGFDAAVEGAPTGVPVTSLAAQGLHGATVAVDFSSPGSVADNARACAQAGVALLVGTTGLDAAARSALAAAAVRIPILVAPNTSVGANVLLSLVRQATASLGPDFDIEISEVHHRLKRDAPSGTALALGEAAADARGRTLADVAVYDRHGTHAPRDLGSIGFSVQRGGDVVGEHTVTFAAAGERLELTHRATDRMTFARGALRAVRWLRGRPAGLYDMRALFGVDSTRHDR